MSSSLKSAQGGLWVDKLKNLFKEENIEEEDDDSSLNTISNGDSDQFLNSSMGGQSKSNSQEQISFLAKDINEEKAQNRKIYEKIADAFDNENQSFEIEDKIEDENELIMQLKQYDLEQKLIESNNPEFFKEQKKIKISPTLDIVEMNMFDRIKLYQDHTIFQKIYKKLWHIKSQNSPLIQFIITLSFFKSTINYIALKISKSSQFETISLLVIAFNSVLLALDDPTTDTDNNATIDLALLIIYTVEMVIKILALGFIFDSNSYMRDSWNIVDIVIIGTGYLPYLISGTNVNLSALRSLRVLRPLKSITKIKALKQLLTALFSAIPLLKDSIIIVVFFFIIFGIGGLQLFTGQLKSRCIDPRTGIQTGDDGDNVIVCAQDPDCSANQNSQGDYYICGKSMISPYYDTIQFDTFGWSVLDVYVVVSLEGWTVIMNLMEDGFSIFSVFYFIFAVYIGAFFLMNLTMAIIGVKYSEAINDQKEKKIEVEQEPGYDMKQMIDWGIYKSNKIYYQELEEDKKIKRSFFGFSFGKKSERIEPPPPPLPPPNQQDEPQPSNDDNKDPLENKNEEKQNLIQSNPQNMNILSNNFIIPSNEENKEDLKVVEKKNQRPFSPVESPIATKDRHENMMLSKIERQDFQQQRKSVVPSISFGSSFRNLRGNGSNNTKILQKKIIKIDLKQHPPTLMKKISQKISDHQSVSKLSHHSEESQFIMKGNNGDEILESHSPAESKSKSHQSDSNQNNGLILPHLLVGQLEQINKSNQSVNRSSSRNRQRQDTSHIDEEKKKNLIPRPSNARDSIMIQNMKSMDQNLIKNKKKSILFPSMKGKIQSIISHSSQIKPFSKEDSQHSPRQDRTDTNTFLEKNNFLQSNIKKINKQKNVLNQFRGKSHKNSTFQQDDWMNDDFLKEMEIKEKQNHDTDLAKENHNKNHDQQIEEAYFSLTQMPIHQLKFQKPHIIEIKSKQENDTNNQNDLLHDNHEKNEPNEHQQLPQKQSNQKQRSESNPNRVLSSKRLSHQSSNSVNHNSSNKIKTINEGDQFSDDSGISFNNEDYNKSPVSRKQKEVSIVFNDQEFLSIFQQNKNPNFGRKLTSQSLKQDLSKNLTKRATVVHQKSLQHQNLKFKRQESRNITKTVQTRTQVDEKFDIQKEEMKLLLDSKYLKARVIYQVQQNYIDDILPQKKQQMRMAKRAEQQDKLKRLRFSIEYSNTKDVEKKKKKLKSSQTDKYRSLPVFRAERIDKLLRSKRNRSHNNNLEQIMKEDELSKKISIIEENPQLNDFQNLNHFQKLIQNGESSLKESESKNNDKEMASIDQINNNQDQGSQKRLSGKIKSEIKSEKKEEQEEEYKFPDQNEENFLQKNTSNKKMNEMQIELASNQFKQNPDDMFLKHEFSQNQNKSLKLTAKISSSKKEQNADEGGVIAKSKINYYLNKDKNQSQITEKGQKGKKKGDQEIKWNSKLAMEKIFNEEEIEQYPDQQKGNHQFEIKDNKFNSQESLKDKILKASELDNVSNMESGVGSSPSLPNDDQEKGEEEKEKQGIVEDPFISEGIEQEFMKIRKNEIHNIEKKGINIISTAWSGESVIPNSLIYKTSKSVERLLISLNHTKYDSEQNEGGILGIIQAIRRRMKEFAHTGFFENSIMLCVIFNTVILSLDGSVTDTAGLSVMSTANTVFTIIFAVDMGLKVVGEGLSEYVSDKMNIFDGFIVCLSLFEMIFLTGSGSSFSAFRAVRILRVFRVLRVTRLIRSLQFMKLMISALSSAISQFVYILLLLFLFMFIYTLLGMSIFGGGLYIKDKPTRSNFDSFFNATLAVLQLLTMENWNDLLTVCLRSNDVNNYISIVYLVSWLFMGNYVFMNLVLAIIMDSFDSEDVQEDKKDIENQIEVVEDLDLNHQSVGTTILNQTSAYGSSLNQSSLNRSQSSLTKGTNGSQNVKVQNDQQSQKSNSLKKSETSKPNEEENQDEDDEDKKKENDQKKEFIYFKDVKCNKSFYLFSQQNIFRKIMYRIYKHSLFDQSILMQSTRQLIFIINIQQFNRAILLSSLKLTIDTYVEDQTSTIYAIGLEIDKVFTAIFAFESFVKMVSLGLIMEDGSYLRDEWSQLDMFIVICSLIDVSVSSIDLSAIKILRLLRTLRPLRLLNHNKSMKLIVTALMESVGGISNMIVVVILIWLMFAILGLNLMKGKLQYCNFDSVQNAPRYDLYSYHKDKCQALNNGASWQTYDINCDNIGNAMMFLFILSSFEAWPDYIYQFLDADDSGPIHSQSVYFAAYFGVFIFVGGFFSINLFSAIMSFNFDIAQSKAKNKYLSDQQSQWIELQRLIIKSTPDFASMKQPSNRFRFLLWKIVTSSVQEVIIIFCILLNIVSMAMAYDTSPSSYDDLLTNVNYGFTAVFIFECILKIIAFGPGGYFFNSWNKFDFFVVVASIVDIITSQIGKQLISFLKSGPQIIRVMRVMRVSRLLKLIKSFQNLQKLIQTTIFALPKLMNATALFLLFYFIFSVLACYLFSNVTSGEKINHLNNFQDFHSAFILLFRCSTGEDWPQIMFDVVKKTTGYSIIYFILFIITQTYIMMNLFVLIIMNEFEENYIDPDNPLQNFREQEESFKALWVSMTSKESGVKIHERFLTDFYFDLPLPLGYDYNYKKKEFIENLKLHNRNITDEQIATKIDKYKVKQKQEADKHIMQMNIFCDYEGFIYFNELFFFFFKFSLEEKINEYDLSTSSMREKFATSLQILKNEESISLKKINFLKKKQSALMKQKIMSKRKEGVNPMVRRLFVGMAFSSWFQYSKNTQKKINAMNFNGDDISSESDTDSDGKDEQEKSDFLQGEDDGIQFRKTNKKQGIVTREHTVFSRIKGKKEREADNLLEQDKYIFLPNTDIYKEDFVQMGEGANFYSQQVFQNPETKPIPLEKRENSQGINVQTPQNRKGHKGSMENEQKLFSTENQPFSDENLKYSLNDANKNHQKKKSND